MRAFLAEAARTSIALPEQPMIVIPAVDLRDGKCVQLVGGDYDDERVRLDDPPAVAREWVRQGFARLHVVDLDAATGRGDNDDDDSRDPA